MKRIEVTPFTVKNHKVSKKNYFLTYWCIKFNNLGKIEEKKIINHPWLNLKKFEKDYIKINQVYEKLLSRITLILNEYHKTNFSKRFWRIYLGFWANQLTTHFYEKNLLIKTIISKKKIKIFSYKYIKSNFVPQDYFQFNSYTASDEWNYFLFLEILKLKNFKEIKLKSSKLSLKKPPSKLFNAGSTIKKLLLKFPLFKILKKNQRVVIFDTALGFPRNIFLNLKNLILFKPFFKIQTRIGKPDLNIRKKLISKFCKKNTMNDNLLKIAIENIPLSFLEDFCKIKDNVNDLALPEKPKVIFTSNFLMDTQKTRYIAECINKGTKLIIGQHGGGYGNFKINFYQKHEIDISDKYLTWGWKENKNNIQLGIINSNILKIKRKENRENLLYVMFNNTRYTKALQSYNGSKYLHNYYYKFSPQFIKNLKGKASNKLLVRYIYNDLIKGGGGDFNWSVEKFLKKKFNKININSQKGEITNLMANSKLIVCNKLATAYLEALYSNIPTILVHPYPMKRIFNKKTLKFMQEFKKHNLYFEDPRKAAFFVNQNWENIDHWWYKKKIQKVKDKFLNEYARNNKSILGKIQNCIDSYV